MKDYNWGTAELVKWYAYNGDLTEGILYKPEDFDPAKKYPMIVYFTRQIQSCSTIITILNHRGVG